MTDEEWSRWKTTFNAGGKPMPNIVKRAESDRRRAVLGMVGFYAIASFEVFLAAKQLAAVKTAADATSPIVLIGGMVLLAVGLHVSIRGTWSEQRETPLGLLAALEKRHLSRRKLMRFMPWGTGAIIAGTIISAIVHMVSLGRFSVGLAASTLVVSVLTALFVWNVIRRVGKQIDRELGEAEEARRLLADEGSE